MRPVGRAALAKTAGVRRIYMMGPEHGMDASLSHPVRTASVRRDGERETVCMDDAVRLGPRAGAIVVCAERTMVEQGHGPGTATQGTFHSF